MDPVWEWMLNIGIVLVVAVGMEFVAWFTHKYVMHGFLWYLHEDHHRPHEGRFEKNDWFAIFFAILSMATVIPGAYFQIWPLMSFGIGMTLYGVGYMVFHDLLFHKRLKKWIKVWPPKWVYMQRIIKAHRIHHSSTDQGSEKAFGFLFASKKYDKEPLT
jgi:beta-carotene 3-hydroxylase